MFSYKKKLFTHILDFRLYVNKFFLLKSLELVAVSVTYLRRKRYLRNSVHVRVRAWCLRIFVSLLCKHTYAHIHISRIKSMHRECARVPTLNRNGWSIISINPVTGQHAPGRYHTATCVSTPTSSDSILLVSWRRWKRRNSHWNQTDEKINYQ